MGVAKFFRFISERYPCINEFVKEFQIPEFDNLYLDMNGIIHICSHPDDFEPYFSITEEKILTNIFHYVEVLFNMIKPKKLFFMAVDGVAPRAKLNQQRARRFKTAKEAEIKSKDALKANGKPLPSDRFDSNCVTPGTVFMDHLHTQLKYFISSKISNDPQWQGCKVILSGHQIPGEGEHKIMDYIRYLKTLPDYDDNTRHCLYGLDADLIMLALCTHEPHFCVLREKVRFIKGHNRGIISPDETEFYFLHLSLLREYLDLEFQELKTALPFQYNLESIIDDWVLLSFLVGNDFIPNLPDLHIKKGAFPVLYKAYKEVLPTLGGYLNENGYLSLPRFEQFMEKMAKFDLDMFEDTYANLTFLEDKTERTDFLEKKPNGSPGISSELEKLIRATEKFELSDDELFEEHSEDDKNDTFLWEFCQHKKNYYANKLDYGSVTAEVLKSQAEGYIRAIQWNLHYYYHGCQSWSWYYPHHYSPYISDIKNFKNLKLDFDMGKPFLPFEQLLAVLPAASKNLVPSPYHELMTSPDSPIKDFYPNDFETDLNGKQHDWEAVVLIPFIDEKRLLAAMKPCNYKLTPEEKRRNQHGSMHVFTYTESNLGSYESTKYFPTIPVNHALMVNVSREDIMVEKSQLKYGLRPGVLLGELYPQLPSLKHIQHTACLKFSRVKVFDYPSREKNLILTIKSQKYPLINQLAKDLLGKIIYINWPYLVEARVVALSDGKVRWSWSKEGSTKSEVLDKLTHAQWTEEGENVTRMYLNWGMEIGKVKVLVYVLTREGWIYVFGPRGKVSLQKIWSSSPTPSPLQVIVKDVTIKDLRVRSYNSIMEAFPENSVVFMLGQPHFGAMGRVLHNTDTDCFKNGRLKISLEAVNDLVIHESFLKTKPKTPYFPCRIAALKVNISPYLLGRITGVVLVSMTNGEDLSIPGSKINIGLNLKNIKKNEELPGYTKKENDKWLYSQLAVDLVSKFVRKFSRVLEYLANNENTKIFFVQDVFPGPEGAEEMKEMVAWIKSQDYNKVERLKCNTKILDAEIISQIEEMVEQRPLESFQLQLQVKPHLLFKNDLVYGKIPPVRSAQYNLLDRVISVRSSYTVPTGLRGFIIGIHPAPLQSDYMYDILFDKPFVGGTKLNTSAEKVFRMSWASFLNITDATRQSAIRQSAIRQSATLKNVSPFNREPNMSAFAQWTHPPNQSPINANIEFKEIWSSLQRMTPQEDALKKILKIERKEKTEIEDPVKSFFEKITQVSTKCFPTGEENLGLNVDGPASRNRYFQLLAQQNRNLQPPTFSYLQVDGGKVMAQVCFLDGKVYSGLPCEDRESACESACLQALLQRKREKTVQPRGSELPKRIVPPDIRMPSLLPDPPCKWVLGQDSQPRKALDKRLKEEFNHDGPRQETSKIPQNLPNSGSRKLTASALEFVPLQAITGKRNAGSLATIHSSKQSEEPKKKTEVIATFFNNAETSSSITKPKRKLKLAAKLDLDPNLY